MSDINLQIEQKILKAINQFDMLKKNSVVVVGVSGGSDSMALLHFLMNFSKKYNFKIIVAHVNHSLRGVESDRDEDFVREFCKKNNLEIKVLKVDVKAKATDMKIGLEECGRVIRYQFFESIAMSNNAKIALAHTLSDNIETIILNLTRGCGLHGLCGIMPVRDNIIRPLMFLEKAEILNYCINNKIEFVEDSSNQSREYSRNKVRLDVVPVLKQINPSLEKAFLRVSSMMQIDNEYLSKVCKKTLKDIELKNNEYCLDKFKKLDLAIKTRCIKLAVLKLNKNIKLDFCHVNLILDIIKLGTGTVNLSHKIFIKAEKDILKIFKKEEPIQNFSINIKSDNNSLTETNGEFIIRMVTKKQYDHLLNQDKTVLKKSVDYDKIPFSAVLRNRRPGDFLHFDKRGVTKSLKKFLNEAKVPTLKRSKLFMIAHENNILWLEGFEENSILKIDENTKKVLIIDNGRN